MNDTRTSFLPVARSLVERRNRLSAHATLLAAAGADLGDDVTIAAAFHDVNRRRAFVAAQAELVALDAEIGAVGEAMLTSDALRLGIAERL